jgi:chromosome segregation ATPase
MADPLLLQSHEDRLQRLEAGVDHSNVQLASLTTGIDGIEESIGRLEGKIDALRTVPVRLASLEEDRKKKQKRVKIMRKAGLAAVIGVVGALATKFGTMVWSLVHK